MLIAVLTAILVFSVIIFCVWRLVKEKTAEEKEKTAEEKEIAAEEMKKATPDPNEFH